MANFHEQYLDYQEDSARLGETKDCGVRATAAAAGVTYEEAHAMLSKHGRVSRSGTPYSVIKKALKEFGFDCTTVKVANARTIDALEKQLAGKQHDPVLAGVYKHVACIVEGKAWDWATERLHRLTEVLVVHKTGTEPNLPELNDKPVKKFEIKRPGENSKCGKLWAFLDEAHEDYEALEWSQRCEGDSPAHASFWDWDHAYHKFWNELGVSEATAKAQHHRWRKFNNHIHKGW